MTAHPKSRHETLSKRVGMRVLELICTICGHVFSAPLTVYEIKKICEHDCYADLLCPRCLRRRCTAK